MYAKKLIFQQIQIKLFAFFPELERTSPRNSQS